MEFVAIIPARYASTRFPGKPLAMLGGKPVIRRVYEQVTGDRKSTRLNSSHMPKSRMPSSA